ncbi:hypothetical protein SSX86_011862 [Deinandra increscens subsp. villosa]|uniref:U-box domain-containing protein n=1 Tax=Deinandra increscens subsp. villosa TaxID=3103831 RepID=A0AAP0D319_9ASTR
MVGSGKTRKWSFLFHKSSAPEKTKTKPLEEFICPISGLLMFEPFVVSSGQTFENRSVEVCRKLNFDTVLADGSKPDFSTVIPNLALKRAIDNWCVSTGADLPSAAPDYSFVEDSVRKLMHDSRFRVSERDLLNGSHESQEHAAGALFSLSVEEKNKTAIGFVGVTGERR